MQIVEYYISFVKLVFILQGIFFSVQGETLCPEPEDIEPCTCSDAITTVLKCTNLTNTGTIAEVLKNSKRHTYQEVSVFKLNN